MKSMLTKSILAMGLAAGMASAAHATQGVTDTEIVIGSNGDLSGIFAAFNVGAIKAAQQMFDDVNAKGGIHGRKIRFVVEDHGYQVPKAVQNFNKLINSDQVFAMILNLGTPHNIAGFPLMEAKQVANVSPLTSARQMIEGDITYKYAGTASYYDGLRAGVKYLAEQNDAKEVCAMYIPSDFGLEVFEAARDQAEAMGLTFAAETTHKPDEQDFVGSIQKLREAGCDIVATGIGVRQTIVAFGTAKKLGWTDAAFIGSSAGFNTAVAKVPEGVTEGYYAAAGWSDFENRMDNPEVKAWAEDFQAKAGEPAGTAAQLGYGAARTLIAALEAAGPDLTAESFQKGMEGLEFDDAILDITVNYGPDDHQGGDLIVISKIEGGKWVEVGRVDPTESQ
ncbi:MAG: ABC transporter substrate-binding protein [Neoaquamicrobium sediminum]|jgi:branched-chain amino acid transport system substrate-binding protein|uniref:ABC transporter substrate-binding protein n=2 Tax=Neoaquamicrobium sediminum TaxID=1849104 RepID=A0ABV3WVB4_9HYPH|nr:ABC transporter substrate-binding protein [Mesorhizobium sediminum]MBX9453328.1 ABC transporter substrate-binding protein [Mesorhizobium sp.]NRC56116.1 ABC transporter substrate-binding protein [Mesorhizobium sediminum]